MTLFLLKPIFVCSQNGNISKYIDFSLSQNSVFIYNNIEIDNQAAFIQQWNYSSSFLNKVPISGSTTYINNLNSKNDQIRFVSIGIDFRDVRQKLDRIRTASKFNEQRKQTFSYQSRNEFSGRTNFFIDSIQPKISLDTTLIGGTNVNTISDTSLNYSKNENLYQDTISVEKLSKIPSTQHIPNENLKDSILEDRIDQKKWYENGIGSSLDFIRIGTFYPESKSVLLKDLRISGISSQFKVHNNWKLQIGAGKFDPIVPNALLYSEPNSDISSLFKRWDTKYVITGIQNSKNNFLKVNAYTFDGPFQNNTFIESECCNEKRNSLGIEGGISVFKNNHIIFGEWLNSDQKDFFGNITSNNSRFSFGLNSKFSKRFNLISEVSYAEKDFSLISDPYILKNSLEVSSSSTFDLDRWSIICTHYFVSFPTGTESISNMGSLNRTSLVVRYYYSPSVKLTSEIRQSTTQSNLWVLENKLYSLAATINKKWYKNTKSKTIILTSYESSINENNESRLEKKKGRIQLNESFQINKFQISLDGGLYFLNSNFSIDNNPADFNAGINYLIGNWSFGGNWAYRWTETSIYNVGYSNIIIAGKITPKIPVKLESRFVNYYQTIRVTQMQLSITLIFG